MYWIKKKFSGIVLSILLALVAWKLGNLVPIVGGPVFGVVLGIIINNTLGKPKVTIPGIMFTSKKILNWAIVVLGAGLSLTQVLKTGLSSFSVTVFTLAASFITAFAVGRILGIPYKLKDVKV